MNIRSEEIADHEAIRAVHVASFPSVVAICKRLNRAFVVVLGDPGYYHRFGFVPASE